MPIYEYQCQACAHLFDTLQKLSDPPLTECPVCGKPQLTKLISAAGFRLKGSGWYETDFKRDKRRNVAGEEGANGEAKAESKDNKSDKQSQDSTSKDNTSKDKSSKDKPKEKNKDTSAKNNNAAA